MSAYRTLIVEEREDRVVVTLHRPGARNAISGLMIEELHEVCALLEREPKLLLLTGHGGVFMRRRGYRRAAATRPR